MPSFVPDRFTDEPGRTRTDRDTRLVRRAAAEVADYELRAAVHAEMDQTDAQTLADVLTYATEEEIRFLKYGLSLADGSAAAVEIVARKLEIMSQINNRRIARRFGG